MVKAYIILLSTHYYYIMYLHTYKLISGYPIVDLCPSWHWVSGEYDQDPAWHSVSTWPVSYVTSVLRETWVHIIYNLSLYIHEMLICDDVMFDTNFKSIENMEVEVYHLFGSMDIIFLFQFFHLKARVLMLQILDTYPHLIWDVQLYTRVAAISSLDGLGKSANWRTIEQPGHGTFPNFITFGLLSQNTMSHMKL